MTLHYIKIVRKFTDTGTIQDLKHPTCAEHAEHTNQPSWNPLTDILETDDEIVIRVALAGISRENLSVIIKNGCIVISGSLHEQRPQKNLVFHQLEINYGRFEKVIAMPSFLEHNEVKAQLIEGLLILTISKKSETIEIPIFDSGNEI
jgi:HSP20 family protein